ncbi:GGDEF domain-containing protein [Paucibacter soli]|uniref:GGDEF domain-containing protein n=1 Tax=Paucibacter soli TaxID=3133433 RepID=UPI0030977423
MLPALRQALADLLLTREPRQRLRLAQAGLALLLMSLSIAVMHYAVWVGEAPRTPVAWWTGFSLGGLLAAYLAIRCGWSLRLKDPSLTVPQMVYAIACGAAGYALAGPVRGAVFPILMVILMFGMFQVRARTALAVSLYALAMMGLAMALMAWIKPAVYVPAVELGHFVMLACMLPAVSILAGRLSQIRERLAEQKKELAEALARIQALATRDELTGLLNRRHMQTQLEQELLRSLRNGRGLCIALLDIDHFKRVNDSHGHAAGDAVLRAFARTCTETLRAADVMARWGGEEFVVLLTDSSLPPALAALERLRERVAEQRVAVAEASLNVTVSAGLTQQRAGETLEQTLERADRLLYRAKHEGRNRVEME